VNLPTLLTTNDILGQLLLWATAAPAAQSNAAAKSDAVAVADE
jgi:hypothetical protein